MLLLGMRNENKLPTSNVMFYSFLFASRRVFFRLCSLKFKILMFVLKLFALSTPLRGFWLNLSMPYRYPHPTLPVTTSSVSRQNKENFPDSISLRLALKWHKCIMLPQSKQTCRKCFVLLCINSVNDKIRKMANFCSRKHCRMGFRYGKVHLFLPRATFRWLAFWINNSNNNLDIAGFHLLSTHPSEST